MKIRLRPQTVPGHDSEQAEPSSSTARLTHPPAPGRRGAAARPAEVVAEPAKRRGGLFGGLRNLGRPGRVSGGLATLNVSASTTPGPCKPDVQGRARPLPQVTGASLSARAESTIGQKVSAGMDRLHAVERPTRLAPVVPRSLAAMSSAEGVRDAIRSMFGTGRSASALAEQILRAMPGGDGAPSHQQAFFLATALHAVCGNDAAAACGLMDQASGVGEASPQLFGLQRVLAQSGPGTDALCRLGGIAGAGARELLRDALNLCSDLENKGVSMEGHSSAAEVLQALEREGVPLHRDIGAADDAPTQLLAKALRYAYLHLSGTRPPDSGDQPAYVAWKKGGFTESGQGTDFDKALGRLHKFLTYVDRAQHGPRTPANLAKEALDLVPKALGMHKSPLSATRHGTLGGDLGQLHEEADKFKRRLGEAISPLAHHVNQDLQAAFARGNELATNTPAYNAQRARAYGHLADAALLAVWQHKGRTNITIGNAEIMAQAREIHARLGVEAPFEPGALQEHIRLLAKSTLPRTAPDVKVNLRTLQRMGERLAARNPVASREPADLEALRAESRRLRSLARRTPGQEERLRTVQGQLLQHTRASVKELRGIASATSSHQRALFKLSDLAAMWRSRRRTGPTAHSAHEVMHSLAQAPFESMGTFSQGAAGGVSVPGAFVVNSALKLGTPLAFPVFSAQMSRNAAVTVGVSTTGGRLFIGKDSGTSADLGLGGVWGVGVPGTPVSAAAIAVASGSAARSSGEGVCITTRNDQPGWEGRLADVVDFMFEQAGVDVHAGRARGADDAQQTAQPTRAQSPSELWSRFAQRFGDDPAIAVSWTSEHAGSTAGQAGALGAVRGMETADMAIGPVVNAGLRVSGSHFSRKPAASGGDVPVDLHAREGKVGVGLSLSQTLPAQTIGDGQHALKSWAAAAPVLGVNLEWNIGGGIGIAKLGRNRDGSISPGITQQIQLFRDREQAIKMVNSRRVDWEAALVSKDATGETDAQTANGQLNRALQHMAAVPAGGNHLYGSLNSLKPEVARRIDEYEAVLKTLTGAGDLQASRRPLTDSVRQECDRLQNEAHRLLKDETSWQPTALVAVETNARGQGFGIDAGIRAVRQETAQVDRLDMIMIPGLIVPPVEDAPA